MDDRRFFTRKDPYALAASSEAFLEAIRGNVRYHAGRCGEYARLLEASGFSVERVVTEADLYRIPPIPTLYWKRNSLLSVPEEKLRIRITSSGTNGAKSKIGLDGASLFYGAHMLFHVFGYYKIISPMPTNYIVLGYQPRGGEEMGAVKTAYGTTRFAPALHREYALKIDGDGYALNDEGVGKALSRYAGSGFPVRFVGFPSYMYFLLRRLRERGKAFKLPKGSRVLLGGGWKEFAGEEIPRALFYELLESTLGIGRENCLEFFSAVEHPIPYVKCRNGHFHIPKYSRVIVRDVQTLEPVGNHRAGLLNFITPLVSSMPLTSVITDDIGVLRPGENCGCPIPTPYFELLGRAGVTQIKTCAAGAAEYLGGAVQ